MQQAAAAMQPDCRQSIATASVLPQPAEFEFVAKGALALSLCQRLFIHRSNGPPLVGTHDTATTPNSQLPVPLGLDIKLDRAECSETPAALWRIWPDLVTPISCEHDHQDGNSCRVYSHLQDICCYRAQHAKLLSLPAAGQSAISSSSNGRAGAWCRIPAKRYRHAAGSPADARDCNQPHMCGTASQTMLRLMIPR